MLIIECLWTDTPIFQFVILGDSSILAPQEPVTLFTQLAEVLSFVYQLEHLASQWHNHMMN